MATKLLIGNLPGDVTEEQISHLFEDAGAKIDVLKLSTEGDKDSVTATVSLNVDERTAQVMVDNSKRSYFQDRKLSFYIPKFFR